METLCCCRKLNPVVIKASREKKIANKEQSQSAMRRKRELFQGAIFPVKPKKLLKVISLRAKHTIIMSHMATGKTKQVAAAIVMA